MSYKQMNGAQWNEDRGFKDPVYQDYIAHHGILGMKWGIRRYQNEDGSLTNAGEKRYSLGEKIHMHDVAKRRKKALEKARITKEQKAKEAADREEKLRTHKLPLKDMTTAELTDYKARLDLEKGVQDRKKDLDAGYQFTMKMRENIISGVASGTQKAVTDLIQNSLGYALNSMMPSDKPVVKTLSMPDKDKDSKDKQGGGS